MGCGSSNDGNAALAEEEIRRLMRELQENKLRSTEQQNLLRFKIEVMVNMLAMEEKKNETNEKRLETLKWMLHEQGVKEQTLTDILLSADRNDTGEEDALLNTASGEINREALLRQAQRSKSFHNVGLVDLAGAIERVREEFKLFKEDIIPAFAEEDGKLVTTLDSEDFMKQLYTVTERITKADTQIIALRFGDGSGQVCVPEFLDFFMTASHVRIARAATSAVRMSLDLLNLEAEMENQENEEDDEDDVAVAEATPKQVATHFSHCLERGTRRVLVLWLYIRDDLQSAFAEAAEDDNVQVLMVEVFKTVLSDVCGENSKKLRALEKNRKIFIINSTSGHVSPPPPPPDAAGEGKKKKKKHREHQEQRLEDENEDPNVLSSGINAPRSLRLDVNDDDEKKKPSRFSKNWRKNRGKNGNETKEDEIEEEKKHHNDDDEGKEDEAAEDSTALNKANKEVKAILAKVKANILDHSSGGGTGFSVLQRKFRAMDKDHSNSIGKDEFIEGMEEMRLDISDAEIELLFVFLDKNSNGSIAFGEFMEGLRGKLNERRLRLVEAAFRKLDSNKNEQLEEKEVLKKFDASKHPDFLADRMSIEEVRDQFQEVFDVGRKTDGVVTREEFIDFYSNIGAAIEDDDYFEDLVRDVWHLRDVDLDSDEEEEDEEVHEVEALDDYDVMMLAERFEVGGYVHFGRFLEYFVETHKVIVARGKKKHITLAAALNAAHASNPFRVSSEWHNLKSCSLLREQTAQADARTMAGSFNPSQTMSSITTNTTRPTKLDVESTPPPAPTIASNQQPSRFGFGKKADTQQTVPPTAEEIAQQKRSRFGFANKADTSAAAGGADHVDGNLPSPSKPSRFAFGRKKADDTPPQHDNEAKKSEGESLPPTGKKGMFGFGKKAPAANADADGANKGDHPPAPATKKVMFGFGKKTPAADVEESSASDPAPPSPAQKPSSPQKLGLFGRKKGNIENSPVADSKQEDSKVDEATPPKSSLGGLFGRKKKSVPSSPDDSMHSTATPEHKRVTIQEPEHEGKDDHSAAESKNRDGADSPAAMSSGDIEQDKPKKGGMFGWMRRGKGNGTGKSQPAPDDAAADGKNDVKNDNGNKSSKDTHGDDNSTIDAKDNGPRRTHSALSLSTDSDDTDINLKMDREFRTPSHMSNSRPVSDQSNSKRTDSLDGTDVLEDDSNDDSELEQRVIKRRSLRGNNSRFNKSNAREDTSTRTGSSYGFEDDDDDNGHNNSSYFEDFDDDEDHPVTGAARRGHNIRKSTRKFR